jgi:hypothetical protein
MTISINPQQITNAANTFTITSNGGMQGMFVDDPAIRNELCQGVVGPTQTTPLTGGFGITESLPTTGTEAESVGSVLALATSQANLTGFTVFNQANALINSPQSPVPLAAGGSTTGGNYPGGFISFFRLGSGARIWVACSSAVAAAYAGGTSSSILTAVYWDYTNQVLLSSAGGTALTGVRVLRVSTNGNAQVLQSASTLASTGLGTWNYSGYAAMIQI